MQFVVTAMDHVDGDASNRRLANREAHLQGVQKLIDEGRFKSGGAILDGSGKMIGSTMHLEFDSRKELDAQLRNDPYTTGNVWGKVDIQEVRLVPLAHSK